MFYIHATHLFQREFKYFNDTYTFDTTTEEWTKLKVNSLVKPSPRSACQMIRTDDQKSILVYGGFSKVDATSGQTHTDMFSMTFGGGAEGEEGILLSNTLHCINSKT